MTSPVAVVLETERLRLRRLTAADAPFMQELLNDPDFMRFVGDRGVRTDDEARAYVRNRIERSYDALGFGLYLVERKADGARAGICGLVKRDGLEDVDLGFALLPPFRGLGIASESAAAVVAHARRDAGLRRLVAITDPDNRDSIRVLERLGFAFAGMIRLAADASEVRLFRLELA